MADQIVLDENPLSLELKSLRASLGRFQEEAHAAAVKLQRQSLDSMRVHERAVHLERENDLLKAELAVLRANPKLDALNSTSETRTQVQELTLSLRRISHKLSLTEEALLAKTTESVRLSAEANKAKASADNAYELGARVRGREEAGKIHEREMEQKILQLEESMKMADVVINEYVALVREMDSKSTSRASESGRTNGYVSPGLDPASISATPTIIVNTLREAKASHEELVNKFRAESEQLQAELHKVHADLEVATSKLDAEKKTFIQVEDKLGRTQADLEKLRLEDGTAAKMVSRYMQFSQNATNDLLSTLSNLKLRHAGTLSTLSSQNHDLSNQIRSIEVQNERLRSALDELGGEIMKEAYGRRREVALRIKMGRREERLIEGLRRWVRRGEEKLARLRSEEKSGQPGQETELDALLFVVQDARILLESLDEGVFDEETSLLLSGGKASEILVEIGLDGLLEELRREIARRLSLEKKLASAHFGSTSGNGATVIHAGLKVVEDKVDHPHAVNAQVIEHDDPPQVPEKTPTHLAFLQSPRRPSSPSPPPLSQVLQHEDYHRDKLSSDMPVDTTLHPGSGSQVDEDVQSAGPVDVPNSIPPENNLESRLPLIPSIIPSIWAEGDPAASNSEILISPEPREPSLPSDTVAEAVDLPSVQTPISDHLQDPVFSIPGETNGGLGSPPSTISEINVEGSPSNVSMTSATSVSPTASPPLPTPQEFTSTISFPSTIPQDEIPQHKASDRPNVLEPAATQPHPLLADLARMSKRYDDLQRAFRDCHLALEGLQVLLKDTSPSGGIPVSVGIPTEILNAALSRLDDYTEDARVELEIRVGDEMLLAKGYEALLSIPGALNVSISGVDADSNLEGGGVPSQSEVEKQVSEFVSGSDPAVRKARELFTKKLEDIQHDIAALKRAIHEPDSFASLPSPPPQTANLEASSSTSSLVSTKAEIPTSAAGGWSSWIRSSTYPHSPAPSTMGPAPTFGNIMTAPRLRHSPSSGNMQQQQPQRARRSSFFGLGGGTTEPLKDPLAGLELRVPMPSFVASAPAASPGFGGYPGILSPTSPLASLIQPAPMRTRTVSSAMYMLGLGAASGPGAGSKMTRTVSGSSLSPGSSHFGIARQSSQALIGISQALQTEDDNKRAQMDVEEETDMAEGHSEDEDDTDIE